MLSFEIIESGKAIQICCDAEGLAILKKKIASLEKFGHVHLRSPRSGGNDLSETTPFGHPAIEEVIITGGGDASASEENPRPSHASAKK